MLDVKQQHSASGTHCALSEAQLKEQDYLGMGEASSPDFKRSTTNIVDLRHLQLETELRLGSRDSENASTSLSLGFQQVCTVEQACKGTKRVYCEVFGGDDLRKHSSGFISPRASPSEVEALAARVPVVGWPPVQSFRKQSFAVSAHQRPKKQAEDTALAGVLSTCFVKVYMDGVSIGRKVDINLLDSYERLSGWLEEMFSNHMCGVKLSGSEYVLTYEDKDGDLMLVGDVPWNMFKAAVKRLRIMKGSEAIGLVK